MQDEMTNPLISILITTYNRAFFLNQCLDSIKTSLVNARCENDIEIIVLNNGCTDDTVEIITRFENLLPLKVLHEKRTIGFVKGLLKCIDSAKGRYCWFLGDDDYIALDNLGDLIAYIEKIVPDILLLNHYFYIFEDGRTKFLKKDDKKYLMKKSKDCYADYADYILDAKHNNAFFTHIAPVIFRRNLWYRYFSNEAKERHVKAISYHTHVLLSVLKYSKKICYFHEQALVLGFAAPQRNESGELTSITEEERYARLELDIIYFTYIFKDVFKEKRLVEHIRDVMLRRSVLVLLLGGKIRGIYSYGFYMKVFGLLYDWYKTHPFFWYGIIPVLMTPRIAFVLAYRLFVKKAG